MTQRWSPGAVLKIVPSSTISPSSSRNAPYRACPTASDKTSLLKTCCAARAASGPRKSHLFSGETSQTATSSRTAAYSLPVSPNPSSHHHPPSSTCVPPWDSVTSWNAVRIASSSLTGDSSWVRACPAAAHPGALLTGRSPPSRPAWPDDLRLGDDRVDRAVERRRRQRLGDDLHGERDRDRGDLGPGLREEPVVDPSAVADPPSVTVERHAGGDHDVDLLGWRERRPRRLHRPERDGGDLVARCERHRDDVLALDAWKDDPLPGGVQAVDHRRRGDL